MPKLPSAIAEQVRAAGESSGFTALPEGKYRVRLTKVEAKTASTGNPMWVWNFEVVEALPPLEPGKGKGRKLWNNTVLLDSSFWAIDQSFAAFGVPTDTDTDIMLGATAVVTVSQRIIAQGAREGQTGNNIDNVEPDMAANAVRVKGAKFGDEASGPQDVTAAVPQDVPAGAADRF